MIKLRIFFFFCVLLSALYLPLWFFVCVSVLYALMYTAYELVPIAVCIDVLFGVAANVAGCLYTIAVLLILIGTVYIKPHLRFY